jgi:hypothetical protein
MVAYFHRCRYRIRSEDDNLLFLAVPPDSMHALNDDRGPLALCIIQFSSSFSIFHSPRSGFLSLIRPTFWGLLRQGIVLRLERTERVCFRGD